MRRAGVAAAVYLGAAVLLTWPLARMAASHLGAPEGAGDPYLNLWVLGWGMRAWLSDPAAILTGRVFDAPMFHPAPLTLTYSDHQLVQALVGAPVYAATGNLTLAYNVILLLSIAASGLAMHALARAATGSTTAAFVAGLAWACWPYRTAHLLHIQLQALWFLPLALWALTRVAAGRRWRDAWALGATAALQAIVSVYYGVMTLVALPIAALALAWATGQWRRSGYWSRVIAAAVLAGVLVAPVALPYLRAQQAEGFGRNLYEAANHSASLQSYRQVPPVNLVYGQSGLLAPRAPGPGERDRQHVEHQLFPGVVLTVLALAGVVLGWRSDARPITVASVALVGSGLLLSAGPEGPLGIYAWIAPKVFGFEAIRAPARFAVVAMLGGSVLAAVGMTHLGRRVPALASPMAAGLVAALMMAEYVNAPIAYVPAPRTTSEVGRWLRDAPEPGPVVYLPIGPDRESTPYMVEALEHGRPIVNGYSGQRPAFYTTVVEALMGLPSVEARAMLRDLGLRFVVSDAPLDDAGTPASPLIERARLEGRVIYEVRWTDDAEAALDGGSEGPLPPPAGPIPFAAGEVATYDVRWIGDLPAGTLVLTALAPSEADRGLAAEAAWRFEASATTAEWVQRMFEARDRFSTLTTGALEPLLHLREIREGARRLDRAYVYDAAARQVRMGGTPAEAAGPDAQASRLAPGARDPVSALYYVRTLPMAVGDELVLPVNDIGRALTVRVRVEAIETLAAPWGETAAFRLAPVIERRLERREAVSTTLWISADSRRVPLRLDLSAGFGRVRAELVNYRP